MTDYTYGSGLPIPASAQLQLVTNKKVFKSPLTGATQTAARPGTHWRYVLQWVNLSGTPRAELFGALHQLGGVEHRLLLPIFNQTQLGTFGGTPLVDGANQTGNSLNVRGATASVTNWIHAGDFFKVGDQLLQCVASADSDSTGDIQISFQPEIRDSFADGDAITVAAADAVGRFMLTSDPEFQEMGGLADGTTLSTVSAEFVEDVL